MRSAPDNMVGLIVVDFAIPTVSELCKGPGGLSGRSEIVRQDRQCLRPRLDFFRQLAKEFPMIRKLASGEYRLYSRKTDPKTGKRRNLGTFSSREQAQQHEREVQYFKRHG